jgi:hypothetical protein
MDRKLQWLMGCLVAAVVLAGGCGRAPGRVVQGRCLEYDQAGQTCVVWDEDRNQPVRFSLAGSVMGAKPDKGDVLRVYYVQEGQAHRVMNVTRTDLFKK